MMTNKASWQIEDCSRALECFLPLLLRPAGRPAADVLRPGIIKKAYGHLRRFAAFHMGTGSFKSWADLAGAALAAHQELLEYGKLAEESLSVRLCTSNLHLLCCRLLSQVLERGLTWRYGELWVERLMGEYKRRTKYRTHGAPEKTMMLDYMVRCALQKVRAASTQQLQTWQEHKAGSRVERGSGGEGIDAEFSPQGQLLGDGRPVPAAAWTIGEGQAGAA